MVDTAHEPNANPFKSSSTEDVPPLRRPPIVLVDDSATAKKGFMYLANHIPSWKPLLVVRGYPHCNRSFSRS